MSRKIFINLPVADLARSTAFYEAVGFTKNPQFSDGTASCMTFSDEIHVMLATHDKFKMFTPREIADPRKVSQALFCVTLETRAAVDEITEKAIAAGAVEPNDKDEYDFMYGRSFEDPDGHLWGPMWFDMSAAPAEPGADVGAETAASAA